MKGLVWAQQASTAGPQEAQDDPYRCASHHASWPAHFCAQHVERHLEATLEQEPLVQLTHEASRQGLRSAQQPSTSRREPQLHP